MTWLSAGGHSLPFFPTPLSFLGLLPASGSQPWRFELHLVDDFQAGFYTLTFAQWDCLSVNLFGC